MQTERIQKPLKSILESIGHTPLLQLGRSLPKGSAEIFAKLEWFNPGGSVKDRIAFAMIEEAEQRGALKGKMTIIEATTGNTGIGLALVCAVKKYHLILVMPENYSPEYRKILAAYGAELVLTKAEEAMPGALAKAEELSKKTPRCFVPHQFNNEVNPQTHNDETAQEILEEISAISIDAFVAGVSSGGTISGVGRALKKRHPSLKVVAVEYPSSELGKMAGYRTKTTSSKGRKVKGMAAGYVPENLDEAVIDEVITVSLEEVRESAKRLSREEGLLVGLSSGAAGCGAYQVAQRLGAGKKVVVIFPDSASRYFSVEKYFRPPSPSPLP